jgi:hypothetical protein
MKSKIIFILLPLAALAAFNSSAPGKDGHRLKKAVSYIRPWDSASYVYTTDGKLAMSRRGTDMWSTIKYEGNLAFKEMKVPVKGNLSKSIYYLNSYGSADSMIVLKETDTVLFMEYVHDKNGFLTAEIQDHSISVIPALKRIYKDGNMAEQIFYNDGTEYERGYYDYYTDIPNMPTEFGIEGAGYSLEGKGSKNLLKRSVWLRNFNDTFNINLHSYHFDNKGRISVDVIYGKGGVLADSVQYFY